MHRAEHASVAAAHPPHRRWADGRCVVLDGGVSSALDAADPDARHAATRAVVTAPERVADVHRRYVAAGVDVLSTSTWGLLDLADATTRPPVPWVEVARRAVRLARDASADRDVSVAFSLGSAAATGERGPEGVDLLARAFADEPPDLVVLETLTLLDDPLRRTIDRLLGLGLPLWLSFRRCREGLCSVHGEHWGGPEGDAFGRAARRLERDGVEALLINCVPLDHVDGWVSELRDYVDLPLGVAPNLGYPTREGWRSAPLDAAEFGEHARRWRDEGAQIVGGCCGVGPEHVAGARAAVADRPAGRARPVPDARPPAAPVEAVFPDDGERRRELYPLPFPDTATSEGVFAPTQGSLLVWRHLFRERVGAGGDCLDIGCGSGLQAVQLARNGARSVHAIDLDPSAASDTLANAARNHVLDRVTSEAVDLRRWVAPQRYDVIVASLYQTPVDPRLGSPERPADYWGRSAVDHLLRRLDELLTEDGIALVMQLSILSGRDTAERLAAAGLVHRVVDFAFFPLAGHFADSLEQIRRVEQDSDAYHLRIGDQPVMVAYLLEVRRAADGRATIPPR